MPSYTPLTLTLMAYPTLLAPGAYEDDPVEHAAALETSPTPLAAERPQQHGTSIVAQSAQPRSFVSRLLRLAF